MTLQDLGNLGDFVGGILVVASLLYLAFQIRQNTRSLRASSYQEATRSVNEWAALFVQDPEISEIFFRGMSEYDSLDQVQRNRFHHLLAMHLRNYSVALRLAGDKLLPAAVCLAYEAFIERFMVSPELRRWWASNEKYFAEQLRSRMRELLSAADASQRASTPGGNGHDEFRIG